jgi:hypothetical protein
VHIQLKCCYTLLGSMNLSEKSKDKYPFAVPSQAGEVTVEVFPKDKRIDSYGEKEVTHDMWEALQTDVHEGRLLPPNLQLELSAITSHISDATTRVLSLLKYILNHFRIEENLFSIKDEYWSTNEIGWKRLPGLPSASVDVVTVYPFNSDTHTTALIQDYARKGIEPFVALRHLQRARAEGIPRHKWIDAAIAAELAIKEYLLVKDPSKWKTIFETSRSPTIEELYGKILKENSAKKEESPVLAELKNGAKIRNDLLHYRCEVNIDPQDAINYVRDVERAIFHLLTLLYPSDPFIRRHYATILSAGAERDGNNVNIGIVAGQSVQLNYTITRLRRSP